MTFKQWMVKQKKNPISPQIGDLAEDFLRDECGSKVSNSYKAWKEHLEECHNPCDEALEVLKKAWKVYEIIK